MHFKYWRPHGSGKHWGLGTGTWNTRGLHVWWAIEGLKLFEIKFEFRLEFRNT